jgi:hypothetical protein
LKKAEPIHTIQPVRFMKNTYKLIWSDEALSNLKGLFITLKIVGQKEKLENSLNYLINS